jgi:tRNA dimethylallyltransferase
VALLLVGGPTASGKTAAAIHVACLHGATIVGADAMQVYRGLDIGTAKPPSCVLRRFPHACVDVRDLGEEFSVLDFVTAVREAEVRSTNVVVVGGTPFYLAALLRPLAPLPSADPLVRAELEALADPHAELRTVDPDSAAGLHPHDRVRVIRALEVHRLTGRRLSEIQRRETPDPVALEVAWLDRPDLDARIEARLGRMVERGYVREVERILAGGATGGEKPLRAFGYRHMVACVRGELTLDEALRRTARDTRRLARKQRTWARGLGLAAVHERAEILLAARRAFGPPGRVA